MNYILVNGLKEELRYIEQESVRNHMLKEIYKDIENKDIRIDAVLTRKDMLSLSYKLDQLKKKN